MKPGRGSNAMTYYFGHTSILRQNCIGMKPFAAALIDD
jgi:hypothetical protein